MLARPQAMVESYVNRHWDSKAHDSVVNFPIFGWNWGTETTNEVTSSGNSVSFWPSTSVKFVDEYRMVENKLSFNCSAHEKKKWNKITKKSWSVSRQCSTSLL